MLWAAARRVPLRYDGWTGRAVGLDWPLVLAATEDRVPRRAVMRLLPSIEAGLLAAVGADGDQ